MRPGDARFERLPNGLQVRYQNRMELGHFYDDIFEKEVYARNGIRVPADDGPAGCGPAGDGPATVLDVGANIGLFTMFAQERWPGVRVFSFEPAPPLFEILRHNAMRYGSRVRCLNVGVSDREGEAELTFYPRASGMSSFHPDVAEERRNLEAILRNEARQGVEGVGDLLEHADAYLGVRLEAQPFRCRMRTLSSLFAELGIDRVDLLKVDVQKSEMSVLAGLADADWPKVRQLVVEVHDAGGRVARMRSLLEGRGFEVATEQDDLYDGSDIFNLYALRPEAG